MDHRKRVSLLQARIEPELMKRVRLAAIQKDISLQAFVAAALESACGRVEKKLRSARTDIQAA
jgi:predicted HicB family RNase H-like nuclease